MELLDNPSVLLNAENPWPGLVSFTEANQSFFFGREQEIAELVRRIGQEPLTIFFGKSGLGKSSILQAGLTPVLRRSAFVPIYIRLDYALEAPALVEQVMQHIRTALNHDGIDAPRPVPGESLWEYMHAKGRDWWDRDNELVKPILMFDQFEELLTLGQSTAAGTSRIDDFLRQLADLLDNRVPSELEKRLGTDRSLAQKFDFNRTSCPVIVALREDFLADLESFHDRLRPIMRNRFRLLPMSTQQAIEVVLKPGGNLVDPDVAVKIVQFVSSSDHEGTPDAPFNSADAASVEPALLSVVLQELNNRRIQEGRSKITADLVGSGQAADILQHFYERGLQGLPQEVGDFIVDSLLTASGARNRIAEEDALLKPGITPATIALLIDRRIIQRQSTGHMKWLELTHDTLAAVVARNRTERVQRRELAAAAAREQEIHRNLVRSRKLSAVFGSLMALALVALVFAIYQRNLAVFQRKQLGLELHKSQVLAAQLDARGKQVAQQQTQLSQTEANLREEVEALRIKDAALVADAEHASSDTIQSLWGALADQKAGDSDRVRDMLERLDSYDRQFPSSPVLAERNILGKALGAMVLYNSGAIKEGYATSEQAVSLSDHLGPQVTKSKEGREGRAASFFALGWGDLETGQYDAAATHLKLAEEIATSTESKDDQRMREIGALVIMAKGDVSLARFANDDARKQYDRVLAVVADRGQNSAPSALRADPILAFCKARAYQQIGITHYQDFQPSAYQKVSDAFGKAFDLMRQTMREDPGNLRWRATFAEATARAAVFYSSLGHYTEAFRLLKPVRSTAEETFNADHSNVYNRYTLAMIDRGLGLYYQASGDAGNEKIAFSRSLENARLVQDSQKAWVRARLLFGMVLKEQTLASPEDRRRALLESRAVFESLAAATKDNPQIFYQAADSNLQLGNLEASTKNYDEAIKIYARADDWFSRLPPDQRHVFSSFEAYKSFENASYIYGPMKRHVEEQAAYARAAATYEQRAQANPSAENLQQLALTYVYLGDARLAAGAPTGSVTEAYKKALSTYDNGIRTLERQKENASQLIANSAEQRIHIASQLRSRKEYELSAINLDVAVSAIRKSLERDLLQPDLFEVLEKAKKEADSLKGAIDSQSPDAEKLTARIEHTKREITDIDKLFWPRGATPNADHTILETTELQSWSIPPLIPGAWVQLTSGDSAEEEKRLLADCEAARKFSSTIRRLRKLQVNFYPDATLFEAEVRKPNGETGVFDYVRSGKEIIVIDGTSNPIHKFDDSTTLDQGVARKALQLDTMEQASQYMRFFAGAIAGDEGTFRIVDSASDLGFADGTSADTREKIGRSVKPFRLRQTSDGRWVGEATVQYGDALFSTLLTLDTSKSTPIEMKNDVPIAANQPFLPMRFSDGLRVTSAKPSHQN